MKLKKSYLCISLVITMLITSMFSTLVFADTLDYSSSIDRMQQLGILDSTVKDSNSTVTRGQLVKSIVISKGLTDTAASLTGSSVYPDINADSDLSGYINAVINMGTSQGINQTVITGLPDGSFYPDNSVTYGALCTVMVRLLGYTDSDLTGAWPYNYIQKAAALKLTTDVTLKRNDKVTYGVEAVMFDRLFDSLMKKTNPTDSDKFFSDSYFGDTTVPGKLVETTILGNSKTSDNLNDNQVLTDTGTYTLSKGVTTPVVGGKYKLYANGTSITKVTQKENTIENYAVSNVINGVIYYTDDNNVMKNMTLPEASIYYYHGQAVNYSAAVSAIQPYSSVILSKNSDDTGYDFAVIVDPNFGVPQIYRGSNMQVVNEINNTKYDYMYKNGYGYINKYSIADEDVAYFVSDLWNKHSYIYLYSTKIYGEINNIMPSVANATSIVVKGQTYQISQYFDRNRLSDFNNLISSNNPNLNYPVSYAPFNGNISIGDTRTIVLDITGKVIDIY
jgi:hypothetical protein